MSRTSHLKELQNELHPLFDQGTSEQEAYDQLKDDIRFGTLRLAKVTTIYKDFRTKQAKKPKHYNPAERLQLKRLQQSEQLSCFRSILGCDHKSHECLKYLYDQSVDGRFFVISDLMPKPDNTGNFTLIDTFSNKTSQIKIQLDSVENDSSHEFSPLTYNTGILTQCANYDDQDNFSKIFVSLLELDWDNKESQKVHTIELEEQQRRFRFLSIIVDEVDSTKLILRIMSGDGFFIFKRGCVVNNEILFKEGIQTENNRNFWTRDLLSANRLHTLNMSDFALDNMISVCIIDLDHGTQAFSFQLDQLPDHTLRLNGLGMYTICIAPDRVFLAIKFKETQNYGIVWSKFEAQQWVEMGFCVKEPITDIKFIGSLLFIQTISNDIELTHGVHNFQTTLYRIPLKKPEKLADLAWFSLVRSKSRLPNVDSYEEAHKYLPYNSEIRAPFEE